MDISAQDLKNFIKNLWEVSQHPFIIAIAVFILGKRFNENYFKQKRIEESFKIKDVIIKDLNNVEEKVKSFFLGHDAIINTTNDLENRLKNGTLTKQQFEVLRSSYDIGVKRISKNMGEIVTEELPYLVTNIKTKLNTYFKEGSPAFFIHENFVKEFKPIHEFLLWKYPEIIPNRSSDEISEFNLEKFQKIKKHYIKALILSKTIWD